MDVTHTHTHKTQKHAHKTHAHAHTHKTQKHAHETHTHTHTHTKHRNTHTKHTHKHTHTNLHTVTKPSSPWGFYLWLGPLMAAIARVLARALPGASGVRGPEVTNLESGP